MISGNGLDIGGVVIPLAPLAAAAGGIGLVGFLSLVWIEFSGNRTAQRRRAAVLGRGSAATVDARGKDRNRRKDIETTLKEIEEKQQALAKRQNRLTLTMRLRQSGVGWNRTTYFLICLFAGVTIFVGLTGPAGLAMPLAGAFAFSGGLALPHFYVGAMRSRRLAAILAELPDALDVIVRGVRSGLPLHDCLRIIGREGAKKIRPEFALLVNDMAVGLTIGEACQRLYERNPVLEMRLLAIILNIQGKAGGNLSEAIGNLSRVLRERRRMKGKIKAISTEATSSAAIIGCLPIAVGGLLYLMAPDYVSLLITTQIGNLALAAGAVWMSIGIFVMRGMINFKV